MGRIASYSKMKIGLISFIFFIFIVSFLLILVSSATEIKKQKNEENEINFLLNASKSEAIKQIASFERGKITEEELYKNLITSSIKENYVSAYLLAEKEHLDIALFVGTKSKIYVDSNLLFMIPIYKEGTYIGYLNYLDFFSMKELSAIYALNNSIEHHFTIKGTILKDGYISLNYFDVYTMSQRIIINEAGEKVAEEFKDILLSYTLAEAKSDIEISIDTIDTPLRNIVLEGKKLASKTSSYLKKEYEYWKNYPYDIIMHMDKDNTDSILDWSYLFYETTKTIEGFVGYGKMAYPYKEAFYHNWTLLLILALLLPIVIFILFRLILKLEQTVKIEEEKRRTLSTAVAHELKTPLGILKVYNEALGEAKEEKRKEYQEVIDSEIEHMNSLILDLLQISKLESSAYELNLEEVDLLEVARNSLNKYAPLLEEKNISVEAKGFPSLVLADLKLIRLVYSNILSNAIHSVKENGKIEISIHEVYSYYEVRFYNNGPKLKADEISNIWTLFYSANLYRKHDINHTGLGLAVVRAILEAHHAGYGCKNVADGVCFWFKIKKRSKK